jgi:hypothetical protein
MNGGLDKAAVDRLLLFEWLRGCALPCRSVR